MTSQQDYLAALTKFHEASAAFRAVQSDYRSRKVGDAEFLAARATFLAADKEFDAAEAKFDAAVGP